MPISGEIIRNCDKKNPVPAQKIKAFYKFHAIFILNCFTKEVVLGVNLGMDLDPNFHTRIVDIDEKNRVSQIKEWVLDSRNKNIHTFRFSWIEEIEAEFHDEAKAHLVKPNPPKEILDIFLIKPQDIQKRLGNQIKCPTCYKFKECIQDIEGVITGGTESTLCCEGEIDQKYSIIRAPLERIQYGSPSIESLGREYFILLYTRNPSLSHRRRFKEVRAELFKRASHLYKCHEFTKLKEDEVAKIINPTFFEKNNYLYYEKGWCHSCQGDVLISLTDCTNTVNFPVDSKEYWEQIEKGHISLFRIPSNPLAIKDPILRKLLVVDRKMEFSVIDDNNYVDKNGNPVKDTNCKKAKVVSDKLPIPWPLYAYNMYFKVVYTDEKNIRLSADPTSLWPMKRLQAERYKDVGPYYFPEGQLKAIDEDCLKCTKKRKSQDPIATPICITEIPFDNFLVKQGQEFLYITIKGRGFRSIAPAPEVGQVQVGSLFGYLNPPPPNSGIIIDSITDNIINIKVELSRIDKNEIKNPKIFEVSLNDKNGAKITKDGCSGNITIKLDTNLELRVLNISTSLQGAIKQEKDNNQKLRTYIIRTFEATNFDSIEKKDIFIKNAFGRVNVEEKDIKFISNVDPTTGKTTFVIHFLIDIPELALLPLTIEVLDKKSGKSKEVKVENDIKVYPILVLEYKDLHQGIFGSFLASQKKQEEFKKELETFSQRVYLAIQGDGQKYDLTKIEFKKGRSFFISGSPHLSRKILCKIEDLPNEAVSIRGFAGTMAFYDIDPENLFKTPTCAISISKGIDIASCH